jgi:hypothetical protein
MRRLRRGFIGELPLRIGIFGKSIFLIQLRDASRQPV